MTIIITAMIPYRSSQMFPHLVCHPDAVRNATDAILRIWMEDLGGLLNAVLFGM